MKKIGNSRAFSIRKYPLFGKGVYSEENPPRDVKKSPFYWWFKFLQLNKEYELAIKGKKTSIAKSVVNDFGDVRKVDFKTWWQARVDLFAEPKIEYGMMVVTKEAELAPIYTHKNPEVINLVVPLNWTNVGIKRRFAQIIDRLVPKVESKNRGVQTKESKAKYKIGRKWNISGFENAYKVYVEKTKADAETLKGGKKVYWADIAIRVGLRSDAGLVEGKSDRGLHDIRETLTTQAIRHYQKAEAFIKAAATNSFPNS